MSSKSGLTLSKAEFDAIDEIICDGLKKKQSIEHILASNDVPISIKMAYNWLNSHYFSVDLTHTHRMLRLKQRNIGRPNNSIILRKEKHGRQYEAFLKLLENNHCMLYAQRNTVEGKKSGKEILSIHLVNIHFQFYFLLNDKSAKSVTNKLNELLRYILPKCTSFEI